MDYWKAPDDLKPETIPPINYERILKKKEKTNLSESHINTRKELSETNLVS